jgi:hypothetical protein
MSCFELKGCQRSVFPPTMRSNCLRRRGGSIAISPAARVRHRLGASTVRTREAAHGTSKYVSAEAIAGEYDVPVSQVHRGAREGWLPVMKFGRYSRFDPEKVKAALEGRGDDA